MLPRACISLTFLLALMATPLLAQSGADLFQRALLKERAEGDLDGAIALYREVATAHAEDRQLAARALLHLGRAYETLGRTEAQKTYEEIVQQYSDQSDVAAAARDRLAVLQASLPTEPQAPPETVVRKVAEIDPMGEPSPDGRYVSYVDWERGNLAVYDFRTKTHRTLTDQGSWEPNNSEFSDVSVWSPDSRWIAYQWLIYGGNDERAELRIIDVDGGEPTTLVSATPSEAPWPVAWSSDGAHILALVNEGDARPFRGPLQIVLVDVEDGAIRPLKRLDEGLHTFNASLSPDGAYVAFEVRRDGEEAMDIHVVSTDGSVDHVLIEHPANDWAPEWTPDGRLLFASNRSGMPALWVVDVTDGAVDGFPRLLREGLGARYWPKGFTSDGTFHYASARATSNIYALSIDPVTGSLTAAPRTVSRRFEGGNRAPFWSPDGRRLAYLSEREAREDRFVLVIHDIETGNERDVDLDIKMPESPRGYAWPQWAPDGDHVYLHAGAGVNHLYRVDVETGASTEVLDRLAPWMVFLPDGRSMIYVRESRIVQRDLESGVETVLRDSTHTHTSRLALSPDATRLAYFTGDGFDGSGVQRALYVMSLEDRSPRLVWEGSEEQYFHWDAGLSWMPDGRQVLLATYGADQVQQVYLVNVDSGERRPVGEPFSNSTQGVHEMRVHPTQPKLALRRGGEVFELWAVEHLDLGAGE